MNHSILGFAQYLSCLAVAALLASTPSRSEAADVALAALAPSQGAAEARVQDLGRIEASSYDTGVWRELARLARHPDLDAASPRRWSGQVDVAFDVARDGTLEHAAVVSSSTSNALDGAALRTVLRARFQPAPGEPRHYVVTFDYRD